MTLRVKKCFFFIVAVFLFLTFFSFKGKGQQPVSEVGLPANQRHFSVYYHQGIVVPHHANMVYFIDDFSRGVELNYGLWRFDSGGWQQYYNYPEVGVGVFYNSYGNPDIYGQGMAIYPYLHTPIVRGGRFVLKNKVALGLGYTNNPFHYQDNPQNHIFGAKMNAFVGFGLYGSYRLLDHWSIYMLGALNHMSNGALKKPNNGINTVTLGMGTRYHFQSEKLPEIEKRKAPARNNRDFQIFLNYGRSQANDFNFNIYSSGSLSMNHLWYHSAKAAWSAGADLIYFGGAPYAYDHPGVDGYVSHPQRTFAGVFGGRHWFMGKTSFFVQVGAYIYSYLEPPQPVYPRIGIRHRITDRFVGNFSVKASFFRSEFIEFGLGYRIPYKENSL